MDSSDENCDLPSENTDFKAKSDGGSKSDNSDGSFKVGGNEAEMTDNAVLGIEKIRGSTAQKRTVVSAKCTSFDNSDSCVEKSNKRIDLKNENTDLNIEKGVSDHENIDLAKGDNKRDPSFGNSSSDYDSDHVKLDLIAKEDIKRESTVGTSDFASERKPPEKIFFQGSEVCQITQNNFCHTCKKWFSNIDHLNEHMPSDAGTEGHDLAKIPTAAPEISPSDRSSLDASRMPSSNAKASHRVKTPAGGQGSVLAHGNRIGQSIIKGPRFDLVCEICRKAFRTKMKLKRHKAAHQAGSPYACEACNMPFKTTSTLKRHMLNIHNDAERPFKCDKCDKRFKSDDKLRSHLFEHGGQMPHQCELCDKGFRHASALKTHMLAHSDDCRFKCIVCEKGFKFESNLKRHILTHKNPFKCSPCGSSFQDQAALRAHPCIPPPVHSDKSIFKCDLCGKDFPDQINFRTHTCILVQPDELPFNCHL